MKLLFRLALENKRHTLLLLITMAAMISLTFATQLEMFSIKVMTSNKNVNFFELFGEEGVSEEGSESVKWESMEQRWGEIDRSEKGEITLEDTRKYLRKRVHENPIDKAVYWLDQRLGVLENFEHLAYLLLFVALFKAVAMFLCRYTTRVAAIRVAHDLRKRYFDHLQSLPMSFYQQYNIGSLSTRVVSDAQLVSEAINSVLINFFQTPFTVLTTFALCVVASWKLSLLVMLGFPLVVLPMVFLARKVKKVSRLLLRNQEHFASVLVDFISGIQTIKVFAMEGFAERKYLEQNKIMARHEERTARYDGMARPITHSIATIFLAGILLYGLYVEEMALSQILFFCALLMALYEPIKKFAEENMLIQRGVTAAERMFEVLSLSPQITDRDGAETMKGFSESIEFDHVSFRYEEDWVLRDLSFTVSKGETVAIVGPTGSGKSTTVQLLPRLYDVQEGDIRIDGRSIRDLTQRSLREHIAFVPQKPFLFLDTVAENIAFGQDFSEEEVREAARKAFAHEFIKQLPQGYDTVLSEAGKNLSGGQQQRLAIARALAKRAPILVMDEATSSLDAVSENHIKRAIESQQGQVTQIIIAHRLSTVENADKIIFIDRGRKLAEGTKDELIRDCPPFRTMWEMMHKPELVSQV